MPVHLILISKSTCSIAWILPPGGFFKINFNSPLSSEGAATYYILCDWQGVFIQASANFMYKAHILISKVTILRNGIRIVLEPEFTFFQVEGDNRLIIQMV